MLFRTSSYHDRTGALAFSRSINGEHGDLVIGLAFIFGEVSFSSFFSLPRRGVILRVPNKKHGMNEIGRKPAHTATGFDDDELIKPRLRASS